MQEAILFSFAMCLQCVSDRFGIRDYVVLLMFDQEYGFVLCSGGIGQTPAAQNKKPRSKRNEIAFA